jgi:hypothetical protein
MTLLRDICKELVGMFVSDAKLSAAILTVVAVIAVLIDFAGLNPLIGGGGLVVSCLAILAITTAISARQLNRR